MIRCYIGTTEIHYTGCSVTAYHFRGRTYLWPIPPFYLFDEVFIILN